MKALFYVRKGQEACCTLHAICFLMAGILALLFAPALAMGQWNIQPVDEGDVGQYSSIAVDSSNKVHISYMASCPEGSEFCYDFLKYATGSFGSWADRIVDSSETYSVGAYSSIAIGQSDHVHISYRSESNGFLRYATTASGTWITHVLDTGSTAGYYTSVAVNATNDHVYITNIDQGTSLSSIELVDFLSSCAGGFGCYTNTNIESIGASQYTSIALDSSANPHISYYEVNYFDASIKRLKHAYYVPGAVWSPEIVDDPAGADVGQYNSMAIGPGNVPHISYYDATNGDLKYATKAGGTWAKQTVDSSGDVGQFSSIAILSNGMPCISYYDATNGDLKLAVLSLGEFGGWMAQPVDSTGDVGQYSDIAVDSAGNVHISYYDATNTALKYATNAPVSCEYDINPASQTFGKTGGTGNISVTTEAGCSWTATSNHPDWITITAGGSGSESGTVTYSVAANAGDNRTGTISVAGYSHTVNQSSATCTYSINLKELYAPSSEGAGFNFGVTAPLGCAWTANTAATWIDITSRNGTGNGPVVFDVAENMGSGERTGTLTIEGEVLTVKQRDSSFTAGLEQTGSWVQITFNNDYDDILTIRPSCYRSYFFMTDSLGKIVPHRDFITAVAIPDDVVSIPENTSFTLNCDLSRMFAPQIFSWFTPPFTLMVTYANYLTDPDIDDGGNCTNPPCYDLWTGAIPSDILTLDETKIPSTEPLPAGVSFFPSLWNADWATSAGETITAQISGVTGTVEAILLNGIVAGSIISENGVLTVQFDAAQAVQSLGSIGMPVMGDSVRAYPRVSVQTTAGAFFTAQNGVEVYTSAALVENALTIDAVKHTVASGTHPATKKEPIQNMAIRIYDKSPGSCAANTGISWKHYPSIWGSGTNVGCLHVSQEMTDANGRAIFDLPEGDFLAIGKFVEGTETLYPGISVGSIVTGAPVYKQLQIIVNAKNEKVPAKYRKFDGSELLVIEPEYVEWDGTEELYPFVFDSVGDWAVTTAISPPEGFVADQRSLAEEVNSAVEAVQFTITDIGSKWIPTGVEFTIKHKNKTIKMRDTVGVKLTEKLAKEKGISIYGEEDAQDEQPKDKKKGK